MSKRDQAGAGAAAEIVGWLVQELRWSEVPITRDVLAQRLLEWSWLTLGYRWSIATAGRRLREAIAEADRDGWPVVSDGAGFYLAVTAEQRTRAADRLRKQARNLFHRAAKLDGAAVEGEPVQGEMFAGAM